MNDLFNKRMKLVMKHGSLGGKLVEDSNIIENKLFTTDRNYKQGMLYDWDMNELEIVDFKFEKVKTHTAEGVEVEYMIHFRPEYHPEYLFKDQHYKCDGKERIGFYIDVFDQSKQVTEKWLIVGKDDRVAFDRYNAFKCNWYFEWISGSDYHKCLGCLRESYDHAVKRAVVNALGGTTVDGELSFILPSNIDVSTITFGTRFMISDTDSRPQVYEVTKIKDTAPLGATKAYLKQCLYNEHTDVYGIINELTNYDFVFKLPIEDLPEEYGGMYHAICDCVKKKKLPQDKPQYVPVWTLEADFDKIVINGQPVTVTATAPTSFGMALPEWHIFIDGEEYYPDEISDYFEIDFIDGDGIYETPDGEFVETDLYKSSLIIKAINKVMAKYIVKIAIFNEDKSYYKFVEMEVVI